MKQVIKAVSFMLLCAVIANAQVNVGTSGLGASLFQQGKIRTSLMAGWGQAFNQDYVILGGGLGYYLMQNLEAGVDGEAWLGSKPHFQKVSPEMRYIFTNFETFYPYIGGFYRHVFYDEGITDTDSAGGRAGLYAPMGHNAYVGGGVVVERQLNCNESIYDHCTTTYPEFSIGFSF